VPAHTQDGFELKCFFKRNRAADGRPKANHKASGALTEMPAAEMAAPEAAHVPAAKAARVTKVSAGEMTAAELAGAEAAHVADVSADETTATELAGAEAAHVADVCAGEMTTAELAGAEAAHVADVCAGEMTATELAGAEAANVADVSADETTAAELAGAEAANVAGVSADETTTTELAGAEAARVTEVSAGEMRPVAVESEAPVEAVVKTMGKAVVEAGAPDEDRTAPPVAIVVIRIGVAVTIVVAGAIIRPIVGIAAVRIAGRGAGDHSGRARIITIGVNVAMSVSPNVAAVACVAMCDIPVHAMPVQAVRDPRVSSVPIMMSGGRRVCGGRRGREDKRGRAERDSRNSKSAKSHGDIPFRLATQQRRANTPLRARALRHTTR
jgi:hypothetical protein